MVLVMNIYLVILIASFIEIQTAPISSTTPSQFSNVTVNNVTRKIQ